MTVSSNTAKQQIYHKWTFFYANAKTKVNIYHFANLMTNEPQVTYSNQNANYVSLAVLVGLYPSSNSYKLVK